MVHMTQEKAPEPIILIPAYQPGQALVESTNQLLAAGFTIVVVDDGSEETYDSIFNALNDTVHVLSHEVNKGKGAALKTGYRYIQRVFKNYTIVTADSDGQHDIQDIKKMVQTYLLHPHTLLLGSRTFENTNVPLKSKLGNVLTRKIFSLITKKRLSDTQTGLRAFDDSLVDFMLDVSGDRFEYETNVLLACSREDIEMIELPIRTIYTNNNQSSHFDPIKDSWAIYKEIIKFASSSLLSFVIDFALFTLLVSLTSSWELAASVTFANIMARLVSASVNFTINRRLVFKHTTNFAKGVVQYVLLAVSILLANTLLLTLLTSVLFIAPLIAKIITEITLFTVSYLVQKNVVFAQKRAYQV